ncbi:TolC family protein [Lewinella cohaerens]|uniref:TolC family protein n=1 Tax=Lewinella cohaerens TaxID=70995 RepID=UPI00035D89D6|nr:TolC family protein [Lewinella cohaerens]
MNKMFFILLFLTTSLHAQSLEALVEEVLANNPALKALESEYFAALERAPQVSSLPDTELGLGGFPLPVETRLGPQALRVSATQMFPWFGTLAQKEKVEIAKAKAAYERIDAEALNLLFELRQAYLQLYEIQHSQTIIQENLKLLDALEQLALAKVESGRATLADVLRVQLKKEELQQQLALLAEAEVSPTVTINQLRQRGLRESLLLADNLTFTELPFRQDSIEAYLRQYHPQLRMLQQQQEVARQMIALNDLNTKPSFGIGVDYIMVNERDNAVITNNGRDIIQLRATVKVPLFREQYRAREREEQFRIQGFAQQEENTLSRMLAMVEQAYSTHRSAMLQKAFLEQQISLTETTLQILEDQYSAQGGGFSELLRLEQDLIRYRLQLLKASVQTHLAKSKIEQFVAAQY